ncbi:hypothetical protein Agabi119p4_7511 [Agaricus bisporus var. burnettii]|uniref:BTB domain-containing protein n=1 Tax=Agaricus bisporus var. burnettii TaxID=192524 RepID=A0A8H7C878_AGABI|nr:hypothetical protein Agabi119p4_7511 [Agaricus bisporus var. burnettii]
MFTQTLAPPRPGTKNRLFNLHRTILSGNSAFFKQMFSLPQPAIGQSGQSDDDHIWCDDPVDDFRALCHILYRNLSDPGPEPRMFDGPAILRTTRIALLAHKYEFVGIENWAHKVISGSPFDANVLLPEDASSNLEVALECAWEDVSAKLATRLLYWIAEDTDEASLATASKLSFLLNVAERHNNISIQASAYYNYLGAINWDFELMVDNKIPSPVQVVADIPSTFCSLSSLNDVQKLCLFRGFAQLSSLQARLRISPLFSHSDTKCIARGRQSRCEQKIQETWKQIFIECDTCIAPMEILNGPFVAFFMKTRISTDVPIECVEALAHKAIEIGQKVEHALPKYFGLC